MQSTSVSTTRARDGDNRRQSRLRAAARQHILASYKTVGRITIRIVSSGYTDIIRTINQMCNTNYKSTPRGTKLAKPASRIDVPDDLFGIMHTKERTNVIVT
jgi:hypothetical protein